MKNYTADYEGGYNVNYPRHAFARIKAESLRGAKMAASRRNPWPGGWTAIYICEEGKPTAFKINRLPWCNQPWKG